MSAAPLYLSRAALRENASLKALAPVLLPLAEEKRAAAAHGLVWSLFADDPARRRDFLWREEAPGRFLTLSARPPVDAGLFVLDTRPFTAFPKTGERLAFALRANPTVAVARPGARGKPVDVVMAALHATPGRRASSGGMRAPLAPGEGRAFARDGLLGWLDGADAATRAAVDPRRPALDWLARQGERSGFALDRDATRVVAYRRVALPRPGARSAVFGQVDYEGALSITDAEAFREALAAGFGRAKAFGCGLMRLARQG